MALRKLKPITSASRWATVPTFDEITKNTKPEKSLLTTRKSSGGRNNMGRMTSRHRGGGHKRMIRLIDFKRNKLDQEAKVVTIEYDPNRSARLAKVQYPDGELRYILCPLKLKVGDAVISSENAEISTGNNLKLRNIPPGIPIHNIELSSGRGGQIVRSAGASAVIMAKEGNSAQVRLPSSEIRLIHLDCFATIGQVGNVEHESRSIGKAGRSRWLGKRPFSRGVVKNPVDHPMGGGEGKSSGGRHPCSPWGQPAKGYKTRKKRKYSNEMIIKRRVKKKKGKKS